MGGRGTSFLPSDNKKSTRAQATSPAESTHMQPGSAAQPACVATHASQESRARKFLATLEEVAYEREDNPTEAALVRELVNSLSSGKLLLMLTDKAWHLNEEEREEVAIAKLDQLIELIVSIRTEWIASPKSERKREVLERRLGPFEGDMSKLESELATQKLLKSMCIEKRAEYDFCCKTSKSKKCFRSPA